MASSGGGKKEASRNRRALHVPAWCGVGLLAASWLLLQPGILSADDRLLFSFTSAIVEAHFRFAGFQAIAGPQAPYGQFSHDFAWFLLQLFFYLPYHLAGHLVSRLNNMFFAELYIGAAMNLCAWASIWVGWKVLRRGGIGASEAALTLGGMFAGSYAICMLSTDELVAVETLMLCLQLLFLPRRSPGQEIAMGAAGGYLTALRPYALPCVIALTYLSWRDRRSDRSGFVRRWLCGFLLLLVVALAARYLLPIPSRQYGAEIVPAPAAAGFVSAYFSRAMQAIFSFSYGIPLTMPFLFFAFWASDWRVVAIKLAGIAGVLGATLLFPFWTGETGIAGNRYILAYLFVLLPEVGAGFQYVVRRYRKAVLIVPLLVLAFLPCLTIRHNVTVEYALGQQSDPHLPHPVIGHRLPGSMGSVHAMSVWNPLFHPAVFGWWQLLDSVRGIDMILPLGESIEIDPRAIPPYGLSPRLLYLDFTRPENVLDARIAAAQQRYFQLPAWAHLFAYLIVPVGLAWAAWMLSVVARLWRGRPAAAG